MRATLPGLGRPSLHRVTSLQLPFTGSFQRVTTRAGLSATIRRMVTVADWPSAEAARKASRCSPAASWSGLNSSSREATPLEGVLKEPRDFTDTKAGGRLVGE